MSKLDTKIINEKLEEVFNKLDSAAKIISLLDFFFVMTQRESIGITTHTKKYFFRTIAFTVYESGFDFNPGKR